MKTNLKGELASSLLAPTLRARFSELFGVASRKSVFAWQESVLPEAQVVMVDGSSDLLRLQNRPPCVIWVGTAQPPAGTAGAWTGRLAQDYTVADLIDMLDRAAVFLLDWKARQPIPAATAPVEPAVPLTRYRLGSWVFLGAPFDGASHVRALALLARQPVTAQQLQTHSGLALAQVADLLQELARRKVLRASAPAATPAPTSSAAAPVHKGLVQRLSNWLKGAGRA